MRHECHQLGDVVSGLPDISRKCNEGNLCSRRELVVSAAKTDEGKGIAVPGQIVAEMMRDLPDVLQALLIYVII